MGDGGVVSAVWGGLHGWGDDKEGRRLEGMEDVAGLTGL